MGLIYDDNFTDRVICYSNAMDHGAWSPERGWKTGYGICIHVKYAISYGIVSERMHLHVWLVSGSANANGGLVCAPSVVLYITVIGSCMNVAPLSTVRAPARYNACGT